MLIALVENGSQHNDPYLHRFTQPDTIIPVPYNPQTWNRFSYVTNNPLRFTDPSGHCSSYSEAGQIECELEAEAIQKDYGITFRHIDDPNWTFDTLADIDAALDRVQDVIGETAFSNYVEHINFDWTSSMSETTERILTLSEGRIEDGSIYNTTVHEIAHVIMKRFDLESFEAEGSMGKFIELTGWAQTTTVCNFLFFNCQNETVYSNPGTGSTPYARGEFDLWLPYSSVYEDAADTFMVLIISGMPESKTTWDRNVSADRAEWFFWLLNQLNRKEKP